MVAVEGLVMVAVKAWQLGMVAGPPFSVADLASNFSRGLLDMLGQGQEILSRTGGNKTIQ